jgi:YNFM family putative membrane transporter
MSIATIAALGPPPRVATGTSEFRKMSLALFLGGFSTFSLLYCVQPLLPEFVSTFHVSPAESALALSLTTGMLALAIMAAGALSQALGRRGMMFGSMALAALLNVAAGLAPVWGLLLLARACEGVVLGGVPAVAMAYVGEEMEPHDLGSAMGLYVAGTAFGGMMGRVGMGVLTELGSWRWALAMIGLLDFAAAVAFIVLLPRSRHFVRQPGFNPQLHLAAWGGHLRNLGLLKIFALGFAAMAVFVTVFNYAGFRLKAAPYSLTQTQSSLIFLAYGLGIIASPIAGRFADRHDRRIPLLAGFFAMVAGVGFTLCQPLLLFAAGIALVTLGFFIVHSVASGGVGRLAGATKGHATSLYLLFYYAGASLVGSAGGFFWQHGGWTGVAILAGAVALTGAAVGLSIKAQPQPAA